MIDHEEDDGAHCPRHGLLNVNRYTGLRWLGQDLDAARDRLIGALTDGLTLEQDPPS